jgi:hypothetical protein
MPELGFVVEDAAPIEFAAAPALALKLRVSVRPADAVVHSALLRCQVQIEAPARSYAAEEQARLGDLFGEPARWNKTLRNILWTSAVVLVPGFTESVMVDVPLPCGHAVRAAAAKYFDGVDDRDVPLTLLFSGTVFLARDDGSVAVGPVPWSKEARFALPARLYHATLAHYFPDTTMLAVRRDLFERLDRFRTREGLPTCDHALELLLATSAPRPCDREAS